MAKGHGPTFIGQLPFPRQITHFHVSEFQPLTGPQVISLESYGATLLTSNSIAGISEAANQKSNPKLARFPRPTAGIQIPGQLQRSWQLQISSRVSLARATLEQLVSLPSEVTINYCGGNKEQSIQGAEPLPFGGLWHWPLIRANICT